MQRVIRIWWYRTEPTNDILAQVGALIKSDHKDNPLSGFAVRKMILAGSSASAAVAQNYLANAHMAQRLADMKPIYDGFMPTSANGQIPVIDVPTILVPTMRETFAGNGTTQPDNDKLRVYEFAGMAHIDSRVAGQLLPRSLQISDQPVSAGRGNGRCSRQALRMGGQRRHAASCRPVLRRFQSGQQAQARPR